MTTRAENSPRLAWQIENLSATEADIYLYDVIGDRYAGTSANDFVRELRDLTDISVLNLHINSPGGIVSDALAIYNALQQHSAQVIAYIESQAASSASFIAMAADKILISARAQVFIHDAHGWGSGNARDFQTLAAMLDEESENIAAIYAERTGKPASEWRDAMRANDGVGTVYRGQAAVDVGLADEVTAVPAKSPAKAAAHQPLRVVAQAEPSISVPAGFGASFREDAVLLKSEAYLEALLRKQPPLSDALKGS